MRWLRILTPYFVFKTFALTIMPFVVGFMLGQGTESLNPLIPVLYGTVFGLLWGLAVYCYEFAPEILRGRMWWQGGPNTRGADHD